MKNNRAARALRKKIFSVVHPGLWLLWEQKAPQDQASSSGSDVSSEQLKKGPSDFLGTSALITADVSVGSELQLQWYPSLLRD